MRVTYAEVKELLSYDEKTGIFRWRKRVAIRSKAGTLAGGRNAKGYIVISIKNVNYKAHRLAWLWMTGRWPSKEIDHKNTLRFDNRWSNLRDGTRSFNLQNLRVANRNNLTKLLGVSISGRRFRARIILDYKAHQLGTFDTAEAAHAAYVKAKREMHPGGTI